LHAIRATQHGNDLPAAHGLWPHLGAVFAILQQNGLVINLDAGDAFAFQATRGTLSSSAVLAHPAAGAELSLVTYASATHVGAVIQQRHRGQAWRPLGFFSAQLNKAEANHSAFDRERLAVVVAIRHFRYMLEGRKFVIFTDHKPLVDALHRRSDPISARQQRPPLLYR
jgi:hypothetical protein